MNTFLAKIASLLVFIGSIFAPVTVPIVQAPQSIVQNVGAALPQATGVFETSLSSPITSTATTMTLTANAVRGGGSISGYTCFTVDEGSAQAEVICGTVSSTTVSTLTRGISYADGISSVTANKFSHRRGADVKITDFPLVQIIKAQNNGDVTFPNTLKYDTGVAPATADDLADKGYVDGVAIAGAPDASATVKGITKLSIAPVSGTNPISVGDNDTRVSTQGENDAQVGNNTDIAVGTGNKFVTQTGSQHNAEKYAVDNSSSTTAYTIALSPIPTSLTDGMVVYAKLVNSNTTTTPTLNVNSLGAKIIVKLNNAALSVGDIGANMKCTFIYDLTNTQWVLQNPGLVASAPTSITGIATYAGNTASGSQTIAHGLGRVPKIVRINVNGGGSYVSSGTSGTITASAYSYGVYDGTHTTCNYQTGSTQAGSQGGQGSGTTNIIEMHIVNSFGGGGQVATITVDATNITLAWTYSNNSGNTAFSATNFNILWEVQ